MHNLWQSAAKAPGLEATQRLSHLHDSFQKLLTFQDLGISLTWNPFNSQPSVHSHHVFGTPRCARRPRLDANSPSASPYLVSQPPPDTAAALWDGEVLKRTGNVARRSQIGKMSSFFSASNWSTFLFWINSKHLIFEV